METDLPLTIATWALVASTLLGAAFIVVGLFDDAAARKEQNRILRQRETIRLYLDTTDHRRFGGRPLFFPPADRNTAATITLAMKNSARGRRARRIVRDYLNYWETIAIGVNTGVLDGPLLQRVARRRVIHVVHSHRKYIDWRRNVLGAPSLWSELEQLAEQWNDDSKK